VQRRASQLYIVLNEAVERFSIKVLDKGHMDAPDPFAIGFNGDATDLPFWSRTRLCSL